LQTRAWRSLSVCGCSGLLEVNIDFFQGGLCSLLFAFNGLGTLRRRVVHGLANGAGVGHVPCVRECARLGDARQPEMNASSEVCSFLFPVARSCVLYLLFLRLYFMLWSCSMCVAHSVFFPALSGFPFPSCQGPVDNSVPSFSCSSKVQSSTMLPQDCCTCLPNAVKRCPARALQRHALHLYWLLTLPRQCFS